MEPMLTVEQVAARLNVKIDAVRRYITIGVRGIKLRAVKMGKEYRINQADLEDFLKQLSMAA